MQHQTSPKTHDETRSEMDPGCLLMSTIRKGNQLIRHDFGSRRLEQAIEKICKTRLGDRQYMN